ncbi:U2 small nuclear ribonucleoprotein B'' 2 isoform X1 [Arachis ipaensis]|uniref:U2 small nuclear ribonucleoprotein B'' 2 isoform X1 n=1 Tax=Arachis ipaensis TaxID=130454 RepID=UPI000A2B7B4D|nr:U2 small nuclear ribonucleoprotein B'' 2 isoform X1 [Arachis ipaensis]
MDDMAAYYSQPTYQYYQHPPPPPIVAVVPPPPGAAHPPAHHLHTQYVPHPQTPPPMFASYGPPIPPQSPGNEVRTLFVAGLPEDVKPREIYNLFREFPGYESSHLRNPTNSSQQPFAFAVFANQQSAIMAMHALNGMVFDLEKESTLYIDLAKSNSRAKRTRIDDERAGSDKKARGSWATSDSAGVSSIHMPGMGNSAFNTNTIGYPSAQSRGNADGNTLNDGVFANLKKCSTPYIPQNSTPCATLFVANLGPSCNEQELMQVFSRYPGFLKLKMQSTYGAPVAFVDFQDVNNSSEALHNLQGTILHSSAAGEGMRLEYPFVTSPAYSSFLNNHQCLVFA